MFNWLKNKSISKSDVLKANCPYCSFEMDKMPTRKQKCKSCSKEFFVRTHYSTNNKILLTDKGVVLYDLERERYYIDKSLIDGLKVYIGIDRKEIDKLVVETREKLTLKFGKPASFGDVAWSVANQMIIKTIRNNDLGLLRSIYFQMALYLYNTGRNYTGILDKSFEINLNEYKKSGIEKVEVLAASDSCDYCKVLNNKIYNIAEAFEKKILPCKQCTYQVNEKSKIGWCRCCYVPSF